MLTKMRLQIDDSILLSLKESKVTLFITEKGHFGQGFVNEAGGAYFGAICAFSTF